MLRFPLRTLNGYNYLLILNLWFYHARSARSLPMTTHGRFAPSRLMITHARFARSRLTIII